MLIFPCLLFEEPLCEDDQLSCAFFSFRAIFHEKMQATLFSEKKSVLAFSTGILLFALFFSYGILYSVVLWSLLPRLACIFTSLISCSFSMKGKASWLFNHFCQEILFNISTTSGLLAAFPLPSQGISRGQHSHNYQGRHGVSFI